MAMKITVISDVTPYSLVDVTDVSEKRAASIFRVESEGSAFLRNFGDDLLGNSSKNLLTSHRLRLRPIVFAVSLGKGGRGIKVKYLKPLLSGLVVFVLFYFVLFCFDSSTEIFSVPFAH
jgi:hypothetical protein